MHQHHWLLALSLWSTASPTRPKFFYKTAPHTMKPCKTKKTRPVKIYTPKRPPSYLCYHTRLKYDIVLLNSLLSWNLSCLFLHSYQSISNSSEKTLQVFVLAYVTFIFLFIFFSVYFSFFVFLFFFYPFYPFCAHFYISLLFRGFFRVFSGYFFVFLPRSSCWWVT